MYKKYIKNKLPANHQKYNVARNTDFRKVAIEKQNYFKNLFTKQKNDIKKTWHSINLLLGKEKKQSGCKIISAEGKDLTEPSEIANHFNNYFRLQQKTLLKTFQALTPILQVFLARIYLTPFIFTQLPHRK